MSQLLSNFGRKGVNLGLSTLKPDIEDTSYLSKYFVIAEFNPIFTGGRNPVAFNGSSLLKAGSEIQVECIDSNGSSLFIERPRSNIDYADVATFVISINIFEESYNGPGKLVFVGTSVKGEIIRWMANITIDKTLQNTSKVRFYSKPTIEARGLLYPVVSNDAGTVLTKTVPFSGYFYSLPVNPKKDVNRKSINPKKIDIDYRLILNIPDSESGPTLYPTTSFNTQMEKQNITIVANSLIVPFSSIEKDTTLTASFTVKKVLDSKTLQVNDPFFYIIGKDQFVTSVNLGAFTSSYTWVAYNTSSDAYAKYSDTSTIPPTTVYIKQSYAEIVYRNLRTFSGFIARHKLYRKSLIYPGDFQLIADEALGALELLTDPITNNKTYALMGSFYNQVHINKYWFTSSNDLQLSHSVNPHIDGLRIASPTYDLMDGTKYAIVKADSLNTINDATYFPYESASFNHISGDGYNSNFISLKSGSLYVLSANVVLEKNKFDHGANVKFYFTSSISSILIEKDYINPLGLKLGEINTLEDTTVKYFADKQMLFFTPNNDYYGTLLVVPYHCNVILSELSLKVYGDYGFSPDILFTKIPFKINVKGEPFQLKAELFDVNSTLVYSDLSTIQVFDKSGESLIELSGNGLSDPTLLQFISGSLTISKSLYLPNMEGCPSSDKRLVGWQFPTHFPPDPIAFGDGKLCYTNISDIGKIGEEYLNVTEVNGINSSVGRAIAVRYTGSNSPDGPYGRRIWIDASGNKITYS